MIYLDNNATTKVDGEVLKEMLPYYEEFYGNPSNNKNEFGKRVRTVWEDSLYVIKDCFNAMSINDFVITSGATESNNLALTGILENDRRTKKHIIVSSIEHPSILEVCSYWEERGVECTYIPVDKNGIISLEVLESSVKPETCLISIMSANNEIGTIQPIEKIAEIAQKYDVLFHTDATQYLYYSFINVKDIPVDMLSFSAHKLHGPKGIGGLYINSKVRNKIQPIILGGGQQENLRSGTLNVPGIVGMSKAMSLLKENQEKINNELIYLRNLLLQQLAEKNKVCINGSVEKRIPNNINIYFPEVSANVLIERLADIVFSTGSACSSHAINKNSYVLESIGLNDSQIKSSIRLGLSKFTKEEEIILAVDKINSVLEMIR